MGRNLRNEKKLAVLAVVKENKNILFGSLQNNLNIKESKKEAWTNVLHKAQSLRLTGVNRQWRYARDHLFGLWKSRTLAKTNNSRKIGTGCGKKVILNEVDELILDIIGKDSAAVENLKSPKTGWMNSERLPEIQKEFVAVSYVSSSETISPGSEQKYVKSLELEEMKINVLESELYLNKLKILKYEKDLGLPPSKFTTELRSVFVEPPIFGDS